MASSDFTNLRVESIAADANMLRYDYALTGTNDIYIYRAVHGGSFASIGIIPSDYGDSGSPFYDNDVTAETYYDYKLSDDAGSTFTGVVSVQVQKKFPIVDKGVANNPDRVDLPMIAGEEDVNAQNLQQIANTLQDFLNSPTIAAPRNCDICPDNGALVLDCTQGCYGFTVSQADIADVNSISINCDTAEVTFDIPDGTTIEVCGWPENVGFTGDECFEAPASSGVFNFKLVIHPKLECPNTRIRVPTHPCEGEYTEDCYDTGSLIWGGSKFNYSLAACTGQNSGCCSGNIAHSQTGFTSITMLSGDERKKSKANSLAGFSLMFCKPGDGSAGRDVEVDLGSFVTASDIIGDPRFGVAINVPVGATVVDFSGLVLMADYARNLWVLGTYSHANLRDGDAPTTISSSAISGSITPAWFSLINLPNRGTPLGEYTIQDKDGNNLFFFTDSGHDSGAPALIGCGFFWVGNSAFGTHAARLYIQSALSTISF